MKKILFFCIAVLLSVNVFATGAGGAIAEGGLDLDPVQGDFSVSYLASIFGVVDGVLHGTSQLLGNMFGVFNAAVLALGTILAAYVLLVSTMNTAHQGEVMGQKWSSIWIPLRMTTGVALLLPKASGYCAIQIFVMWVVVQGIGAADSIWANALGYLARGGVIVQQPLTTTEGVEKILPATGNIMKSLVCLNSLQKYTEAWREKKVQLSSSSTLPGPVPSFVQSSSDAMSVQKGAIETGWYVLLFPNFSQTSDYRALNGVCGQVKWQQTISGPPSGGVGGGFAAQAEKLVQSMAIGIQQIISNLSGPAEDVYNNSTKPASEQLPLGQLTTQTYGIGIPLWVGSGGKPPLLQGSELVNAATDYVSLVLPALNYLSNIVGNAAQLVFMSEASQGGWIRAGQYYFNLTQMNNKLKGDIESSKPTTVAPADLTQEGLGKEGPYTYAEITSEADRQELQTLVNTTTANYVKQAQSYPLPYKGTTASGGGTSYSGKASFGEAGTALGAAAASLFSPAAALGAVVVMLGAEIMTNYVLGGLVTIGSQAQNTNPIADLSNFGMGLLTAAATLWLVGAAIYAGVTTFASVGACMNPMPYALLAFSMWFLPMWTLLIGLMFTTGAFLQFYIPLIPFIVFTFGAIGWLIGVIEAMIAAPLVGLAIATPEGHEAMGKSVNGFLILIGVFLRPSLMLFGFFAGVILSYVAIWLINQGFTYTIIHAFAAPGKNEIDLSRLGLGALFFPVIIICIYTPLVVMAVNKSFSLIHKVPDDILKYIGGQAETLGSEVSEGARQLQSKAESGMGQMAGAATGKMHEAGQKAMDRHEHKAQRKMAEAEAGTKVTGESKPGSSPEGPGASLTPGQGQGTPGQGQETPSGTTGVTGGTPGAPGTSAGKAPKTPGGDKK